MQENPIRILQIPKLTNQISLTHLLHLIHFHSHCHTHPTHKEDQPIKTLHDYLQPTRNSSCIMFLAKQQNFDFKPEMIPLFRIFHGMDSENSYVHIREFEKVVAAFHS